MTPFPYSIEEGADISEALAMMHEHDIQHLPVVDSEGKLAGLLWDRDIRVARELEDRLPIRGIEVGRVCNRSPYVVDMEDRLDNVVLEMADRRVAAAVITRNNDQLAGILTTTDVARLLGEQLRADAHVPNDGNDGGDAA